LWHSAPRAVQVRAFVDKEIMPYCGDWDEAGEYPRDLASKAYEAGVLAPMWPKEYGGTPPEVSSS